MNVCGYCFTIMTVEQLRMAPKPNSLQLLQKTLADPWSRKIIHINQGLETTGEKKMCQTKNSCYYKQNILLLKIPLQSMNQCYW